MSNARQRALLSALGIQQWIPRAHQTVISKKSAKARSAMSEQLWRQGNEDFFDDSNPTKNIADSINKDASLNQRISQTLTTDNGNALEVSKSQPVSEVAAESVASTVAATVTEPIMSNPGLTEQQLATAKQYQLAAAKSQTGFSDLENPQVADLASKTANGETGENNTNSNSSFDEFGDVDHLGNALQLHPSSTTSISFRLQACEINEWIILIHEDDLQDSAMHTLWQNILKAFNQPEITHFSWPLSEGQRWQRSMGAKSALNGFLFRLGLDKRVGLMSELPDNICPDRLERLPHLTELLAEPLKKRTLWHLLNSR